ncbi:MAG: hypothetical protein AB7N65_19345, partial [Vicinamibacterales bacterium]
MTSRHVTAVLLASGLGAGLFTLGSQTNAAEPQQGQQAPAAPIMSPGPSAARYPKTADDFD